MKREPNIRISRNLSGVSIGVAILVEKTFNVASLVEKDGA